MSLDKNLESKLDEILGEAFSKNTEETTTNNSENETVVKADIKSDKKDEDIRIPYDENSGIDERIIRAVREMGFEYMSPIQQAAIPVMMEGKDIIGQAQTGTGKTASFGIPLLQRVDPQNKH